MSCFGIRMDGRQDGCAFGAGSTVMVVSCVSHAWSVVV